MQHYQALTYLQGFLHFRYDYVLHLGCYNVLVERFHLKNEKLDASLSNDGVGIVNVLEYAPNGRKSVLFQHLQQGIAGHVVLLNIVQLQQLRQYVGHFHGVLFVVLAK